MSNDSRPERSPSYCARQHTAKVNHNSKLLPTDFFPKTLSQSPKKRNGLPISDRVLADWYEEEDNKEKQRPFYRISNRASINRISMLLPQETAQ